MVVNQSAYLPDWAKSPPEGHAACTVEQLNAVNQKCFTLDKKALLFGRVDQVCDIVVSHVSASRVHACLAFDADVKLHVADLGSTHGTFVDGQRLGKKERIELVHDTSIVTFGTCPLQFQVKCQLQQPHKSSGNHSDEAIEGTNTHTEITQQQHHPATATRSVPTPDAQQYINSNKAVHGESAAANLAQQATAQPPSSSAEASGRDLSAPAEQHTRSADIAAIASHAEPATLDVPASSPAVPAVPAGQGSEEELNQQASATASMASSMVNVPPSADQRGGAELNQQAAACTAPAERPVGEELDQLASTSASARTAQGSDAEPRSPKQAASDSALQPVGEELDTKSSGADASFSLHEQPTEGMLDPTAAEETAKSHVSDESMGNNQVSISRPATDTKPNEHAHASSGHHASDPDLTAAAAHSNQVRPPTTAVVGEELDDRAVTAAPSKQLTHVATALGSGELDNSPAAPSNQLRPAATAVVGEELDSRAVATDKHAREGLTHLDSRPLQSNGRRGSAIDSVGQQAPPSEPSGSDHSHNSSAYTSGSGSSRAASQSPEVPLPLPSWRQQEQQVPSDSGQALSLQQSPKRRTHSHQQRSEQHPRSVSGGSSRRDSPSGGPSHRNPTSGIDPTSGRPNDRHRSRHHLPYEQKQHHLDNRSAQTDMHRERHSNRQQIQYRQPMEHQQPHHRHRTNDNSLPLHGSPPHNPHQAGLVSASPRQYPGKASYKRRMSAEPLQPFPDQHNLRMPSAERIYPGKGARPHSSERFSTPREYEPGANQSFPGRNAQHADLTARQGYPDAPAAQPGPPQRVYPGKAGRREPAMHGRDASETFAQGSQHRQPGSAIREQSAGRHPRSYPSRNLGSDVGRGASEAAGHAGVRDVPNLGDAYQDPSQRHKRPYAESNMPQQSWQDDERPHSHGGTRRQLPSREARGQHTAPQGSDSRPDWQDLDQQNPHAGQDRQHSQAGLERQRPQAGLDRQRPQAGLDRQHPQAGLDRQCPQAGLDRQYSHAGPDRQGPSASLNRQHPQGDNRHGNGSWEQSSQQSMQAPPNRHASRDRHRHDEAQPRQLERRNDSDNAPGHRGANNSRLAREERPRQDSGKGRESDRQGRPYSRGQDRGPPNADQTEPPNGRSSHTDRRQSGNRLPQGHHQDRHRRSSPMSDKPRRRSAARGSDGADRSGGHRRRTRSPSPDQDQAKRRKASGFSEGGVPTSVPGSVAGDPTSAAAAVARMQGLPSGGTGLTLEQKKSKLWGSKAAETALQAEAAAGSNRWNTAAFSSQDDKKKFDRLMGVKNTGAAPTAAVQPGDIDDREAFSREQQQRVLGDLESQYVAGLRRKDGRTVGLGL